MTVDITEHPAGERPASDEDVLAEFGVHAGAEAHYERL